MVLEGVDVVESGSYDNVLYLRDRNGSILLVAVGVSDKDRVEALKRGIVKSDEFVIVVKEKDEVAEFRMDMDKVISFAERLKHEALKSHDRLVDMASETRRVMERESRVREDWRYDFI